MARGERAGTRVHLRSLETFETLDALGRWLAAPGHWVGGFDLPLGLPRELVQQLGWPQEWSACMRHYGQLSRAEIRDTFAAFCAARPAGAKWAHRATDRPAGSSPSMKWINPPVAYMLHAGVPLLLAAGVHLPGLHTGDARRVALEAYPGLLARELKRFPPDFVHAGQPMAVSITQATEAGTLYSLDDIAAVSKVAKAHGLPLHMDGARFANALVALDCTPAEMTWKAGVDALSLGGTKNGCWCAEALVFFDPQAARDLPFIRKRAAQLFSKTRFIAAQFEAYLENGLWLETASHANAMAARLASAIDASGQMRLAWQPQANEVFAIVDKEKMERLQAAGAVFYPWNPPHGFEDSIGEGETLTRLVTSFATTADEVEAFGRLIGG